MVLVASSVIFAQTGDRRIDNGLAATVELAKVIGNEDFKGTMGQLVKSVTPYLGMVGPAIGLMFSLLMREEKKQSPELMFMQEMLAKIERRFDKIDKKLEIIVQKITWGRVQTQFFFYERKIKSLRLEFDKLYKYNGTKKSELTSISDTFVKMYESSYENSGQLLYDHIVSGRSIFSTNLIKDAIQAFDYDRKKTQTFMLGLTELILAASQIEIAYNKLKHPYYLNVTEAKWRSQMFKMRQVLEAADRAFEKNPKILDVAIKNAKQILDVSKYKRYDIVVLEIYKKLKDKFYWRNWFVALYDAIGGDDKHSVRICNGTMTYSYNGFNLVLASNPKSTPTLHYNAAMYILRSVSPMRPAKEITNSLAHLLDCKNYSALGTIETNAHVYFAAERYRLVPIVRDYHWVFLFQ